MRCFFFWFFSATFPMQRREVKSAQQSVKISLLWEYSYFVAKNSLNWRKSAAKRFQEAMSSFIIQIASIFSKSRIIRRFDIQARVCQRVWHWNCEKTTIMKIKKNKLIFFCFRFLRNILFLVCFSRPFFLHLLKTYVGIFRRSLQYKKRIGR